MALGITLDRIANVGAADLRPLAQRYSQGADVAGVSAWSAVDGGTGQLLVCELRADHGGGKGFSGGDTEPGPSGGESDLFAPDWARRRRWTGAQILPSDRMAPAQAGGLLTVYLEPPPAMDEEFNVWYNTEHIPRLSAVPGVLAARRFRASAGSPRYLAVYHLAAPEVCSGPVWQEAAMTPWRYRIIGRILERHRVVYRPLPI